MTSPRYLLTGHVVRMAIQSLPRPPAQCRARRRMRDVWVPGRVDTKSVGTLARRIATRGLRGRLSRERDPSFTSCTLLRRRCSSTLDPVFFIVGWLVLVAAMMVPPSVRFVSTVHPLVAARTHHDVP